MTFNQGVAGNGPGMCVRFNDLYLVLLKQDGKIRITDRDIIDGAEAVQQAVGKGTVPSLSSALGGYRGRFSN